MLPIEMSVILVLTTVTVALTVAVVFGTCRDVLHTPLSLINVEDDVGDFVYNYFWRIM